ncbi:MAG TPA: Lrp/AsnC ligand binding domain-containing protein [Salinisphaeraceae bacterium]|nr:Lrp/AsnC ligand binding domain-containing protein [Salinisphaeraceae bacterium]
MARKQRRGLDRTDRRILQILQQQGRISNVDLARAINLSTTPCAERVHRLERLGVITGYQALIEPEKVGLPISIFVEVKLDHTTAEAFERFHDTVVDLNDVAECYMIAGDFDYLLKLMVSDMAVYRRFMTESLPRLPDVQQTRSYVVVDKLKQQATLPIA